MQLKRRFTLIEAILHSIILTSVLLVLLKIQYKLHIKYIVPTYNELLGLHYKAFILILISWFLLSYNFKFYNLRFWKFYRILTSLFKVFLPFSFIVFTISGLKNEDLLSKELIFVYLVSTFLLIFLVKLISFLLQKKIFQKGNYITNVMIFGYNSNVLKFKKITEERKDFGVNILMHIEFLHLNEGIEKYEDLILQNNIKSIYIAQNPNNNQDVYVFAKELSEKYHLELFFIPFSFEEKLLSLKIDYFDTMPIYSIRRHPLDHYSSQIIKTLFDIIFSSFVCVFILSWLFPIIALLIKLDSKGPIIFIQKRRGLNGKEFDCFKFRTMRNDGTNSIKATVVNDNRITRIGNFLRKTSMDELPQFFNVLNGDMSIVGPRPHMISQDMYYSEIIRKYNLRNYVKPGITGLAQVKGYRGAIDCDKDMEDRIRTDIFYVRNWSILLDIQIIYQTVVLVFKGDENAI
ncbi:exopolysaccharide biosynthesis polyprenyl glycosylphosphotransferase [Empedobacter brevis]|uniref:Undecaprenyl-phosphate glucose phosphotransferase n=1 Tax=Empedobacter brevis NBRC 14943 = ATCC 43319 TaxID=1218108 RepID=A0A511NMG5_9FLAO|nr:exopolysaccharide biosynthesis polyprenyl glycosylphosphotransferase [Empedobacter brevis]GEM53431.1 undecaprenyl-phosphate glucose phosphotransferase [Empedobacter brevis NBRC 14943 = ATCC 43319]